MFLSRTISIDHFHKNMLTGRKLKLTVTKQLRDVLRLPGSVLSTMSMSLPNLLTMRPVGVVSKKLMGARTTRASIAKCIPLDAITAPNASANELIQFVITESTILSLVKLNTEGFQMVADSTTAINKVTGTNEDEGKVENKFNEMP